ncbi:heterokaryon incompatibility protein-domain-containing protein [Ilyonectria robusta]|uniref:heterokaryon incompatibility protein-domain-containing protein n=1 Tax=Ilyonectria robusta TaxID=1079257 RepID=UPI001E8D8908|nr:heterokaryon incompatibility protein-domain-containing protein [Ilyonectria robusta]KAH8679463.1 heterokaryon incompatibility protein-domain-containing protein [Ilyonectria robusta]
MNSSFSYKPLSKDGEEIRLLTLSPIRLAFKREGQDDSAAEPLPECQLDHYSLKDYFPPYKTWLDRNACDVKLRPRKWSAYVEGWAERNAPTHAEQETWAKTARNRFRWGDYWALSYVWGDQSKRKPILLNGVQFSVTQNLYQALCRLAEEPQHVVDGAKLWVDAICINQADLPERQSEVARMGDIYSLARGVDVWLGLPLSEDQGRAIQGWQELYSIDGDKGPEELLRTDVGAGGDIIHSVVRLSFEPYWERVWVIQELALASRDSLFFYGEARLSLDEMYSMIRFAGMYGNWDGHYASGSAIHVSYSLSAMASLRRASELVTRAILPAVPQPDSLVEKKDPLVGCRELLSLMAGGKATDLRDKAYGIRALMPSGVSARILPDYSATKEAVWSRFTKAIIEESDNLNILASTKLAVSDSLPSWVLNLDSPRDGGFRDCCASGSINAQFRFSENCMILHCQGLRVDTIRSIGAPPKLDSKLNKGSTVKFDFPEPLRQSVESENREHVNIDDDIRLNMLKVLMGDPSLTLDDLDGPTIFDFPMIDFMSIMEKLNSSLIMGDGNEEYQGNYLRQKILDAHGMEDVATSTGSISDDGHERELDKDHHREFEEDDITPEETAQEWLAYTVEYWRHLAMFSMWRRANAGFKVGEYELADFFHWSSNRPPRDKDGFAALVERAGIVSSPRTLVMTEKGQLGLASAPVQPRDGIYVVMGCDWPLAMRAGAGGLEIVGNCFINGLMQGEAVLELPAKDCNGIDWLTIC